MDLCCSHALSLFALIYPLCRDIDQLEPHLIAAIECSRFWYYAVEAQSDAYLTFIDTIPKLVAVENGNLSRSGERSPFRMPSSRSPPGLAVRERDLWEIVYCTLQDSILPSLECDCTVINTRFYEPHVYFGTVCLAQSRQNIGETRTLPTGDDEHVDASLKTSQEWSISRRIRHGILLEYNREGAVEMMFEVGLLLT